MNLSIRRLLHRLPRQSDFTVTVPDLESRHEPVECRLLWASRLHHETVFPLPDGGFHQVNLAIVSHPRSLQPHAYLIASHHDHEGPWQEILPCDELLDYTGWESFLDCLYSYRLDSGLDLTVTYRDAFLDLMPDWIDALV